MCFKYLDMVFFEVVLFCGFSISFSNISFEVGFFFQFKVDVCMIDFVYSIFKGFWDDFIVYDGLDRGYVFGLENFISIMEQMWDENQQVLFWVFRIFFFYCRQGLLF